MTFEQSIDVCFRKYANFTGRATRSEYWWFVLFTFLLGIITTLLDMMLLGMAFQVLSPFYLLGVIVTLFPSISVSVRRLHDHDYSGWWYLLFILSIFLVIGFLLIPVWIFVMATKGTSGPNRFGDNPLADAME